MNTYKEVYEIFDFVNKQYKVGAVTLRINSRLRNTWGRAIQQSKVIELQEDFFRYGNIEIIEDVIRHELAHLKAYQRYGKKAWNHGKLWQETAEEMLAQPTPYVTKEIAYLNCERPKLKYSLICDKCGYEYQRKTKPTSDYSCLECGGNKYNSEFPLRVVKNH